MNLKIYVNYSKNQVIILNKKQYKNKKFKNLIKSVKTVVYFFDFIN